MRFDRQWEMACESLARRPGLTSSSRRHQDQCGFSLLEAIITIAIITIVTSIGVLAFGPPLRSMHADTGCQATLQVLRQARQNAIDQRVAMRVTFNTPVGALHSMTTERMVPAGAPVFYTQIPLPSDVQFFADPNLPIPPNTPDGVGNGRVAVDFEDGFSPTPTTQVYFMPDGSAQNAAGNTINGVVYMEQTGFLNGARAVTFFGATGRLRSWQLSKTVGGYTWQ